MKYESRTRTNAHDWFSLVLVIVGAIVWGLIGLGMFVDANWNVVTLLLGSIPAVEAVVYLLVGLAGLYEVYFAYQLYGANSTEEPTKREAA